MTVVVAGYRPVVEMDALLSQAAIDELFSSEATEIDAALPLIRDKLKKLLTDSTAPSDDRVVNLDAILTLRQHVEALKRKNARDLIENSQGVTILQELESLIKKFHIVKQDEIPQQQIITSFVQRDTNAYHTFKRYSNVDRMLNRENFTQKKLTAKQLFKQKLLREADDLVAQMKLIKKQMLLL